MTDLHKLLDRNNEEYKSDISKYITDLICNGGYNETIQFVKLFRSTDKTLFDQLQILLPEYKDIKLLQVFKNCSPKYDYYILIFKS